jgi:subtilase family serine protease
MKGRLGFVGVAVAFVAVTSAYKPVSRLWAAQQTERARVLVTKPIDETQLITLRGNTRREAKVPAYDRGRVENNFPMEYALLQLRRPPELERAFEQSIDSLTDKSSPNFHHWLSADEQGQQYGLAQQDLDTITSWLRSHGFTVDRVYPNRMVIAFSGTAGEILEAFHTEIHYLEVNGEQHFANVSDPEIPAALAPAIVGVVSMHNFKPHPMNLPRTQYTFAGCSTNCYTLVPGDFQTIYNLTPLFRLGIMGQGQTIAIVEDSDTYESDVTTYRKAFGLVSPNYTGTVTTTHPGCTDPGTTGDDVEADIDAEVASAVAPDASIEMATCADTMTFGGLIAIENLISAGNPPAIMSMSYGECEAVNSPTNNAAFNAAFQSAAAAGVSVFVSAGDSGASSCAPGFPDGSTQAYSGIGVTGWGESVYNVSVGGTDFEDFYNANLPANGGLPQSTYWNSGNTSIDGSAKSYIPEIPWNDSCASYLIYSYEKYSTSYGSGGYCNYRHAVLSTVAGGGGPSGCATGGGDTNQTSYGEVDGTCTGYPKPSWQSGIFGNPADGVRDVPDVSLFAANGIWGHYVIICFSDTSDERGGKSCSGAPSTWTGFGGTSVATPLMASIQALVNQKWGTAWQEISARNGNPDPIYYQIAKAEFGTSGNTACYSIGQPPRRGLAAACAFYDITQGDTDVDCAYNGTLEAGCYAPSGVYGALSTQALTTGTVTAAGSGYTSTPSCAIGAPSNLGEYLNPSKGTIWGGGSQADCSATIAGGSVSAVSISNGGQGYAGGANCTISGGGGSGATCSASPSVGTAASSYQPAYGATPGWDFATGIGSVNAYNLVFNNAW